MPKVEAIIYDVDGTMINSEPIHVDAWDRSLRLHEFKLLDLSNDFRRTMAGKKPITIAQEMVNALSIPVTPEELLREKSQLFITSVQQNLEMMPGVLESIQRFHQAGYKLGIGTALDRGFLDSILSKINIQDFFDAIVTSDQIKKGKPDPETYLKVAEKLNVSPAQCLVLEDAESGILSAKAAGAFCIAIENKDALPQDTSKADMTVESMNDLTLELIGKFQTSR